MGAAEPELSGGHTNPTPALSPDGPMPAQYVIFLSKGPFSSSAVVVAFLLRVSFTLLQQLVDI